MSRQRRVLIVCDGPVPHLRMNYRGDVLARYLASERDDHVEVVCPRPELILTPSEIFPRVRFHFLPAHRTVGSLSDALRRMRDTWIASFTIKRILHDRRVDCIRPVSTFPTMAAILARGRRNVPVLANLSDFYSDLYVGSRLPLAGVANRLIALAEQVACRADLVVVDTPEQRARWETRGVRHDRCIALPHGLPRTAVPTLRLGRIPPLDLRRRFAIPSNAAIALYVGDISEIDGVDVLLQAAATATRQGSVYTPVLVGSGSQAYISTLEQLARRLGVVTHRLPSLPNEGLPDLFTQATVCVAPFRISDTTATALPNKVLEYLTSDRPIIATGDTALQRSFGGAIRYSRAGDAESLTRVLMAARDGQLSPDERMARERLRSWLAWPRILERESALIDLTITRKLNAISDHEMILEGEQVLAFKGGTHNDVQQGRR